MAERARSFGSVAAAYERFRPGYPETLAERVLEYADRPIRTALEIGAGTGKATRLFAGRWIEVTATDPDQSMLDELRDQVPPSVVLVRGSLEELSPDSLPGFDLVFAAAALHWTETDGRWSRIARLLRPGGVFASFGGPIRLADAQLEQAVVTARAPYLAEDDVPSPDGTPPESALQWPGTELLHTDLFTGVRQVTIERRQTLRSAEYVGYLSTVSAYLELAETTRDRTLLAIEAVLPVEVEINADLTLHLARRSPVSVSSAGGRQQRPGS